MDLDVTTQLHEDAVVVTPRGEVDVHSAAALREPLIAAQSTASTVIVDLSEVPFMDSTGLGVLVGALGRALEADQRLVLVGVTERTQRLLTLTGLDERFVLATDVEAALASHA